MSDIIFDCPGCVNEIVVDERGGGMELPCPHCSRLIIIPAPDPFSRLLDLGVPAEVCHRFYGVPEDEGWNDALESVALHGPAAAEALCPLLASADDNLKLSALLVLTRVALPSDIDLADKLISALSSGKSRIRYNAAKLLGKLHDGRAVEPLTEVMKRDSNPSVRERAQWSLKELIAARRVVLKPVQQLHS